MSSKQEEYEAWLLKLKSDRAILENRIIKLEKALKNLDNVISKFEAIDIDAEECKSCQ